MTSTSDWLAVWRVVHWVFLATGATGALFLLLHSVTFHRIKRRMADLLLSGISLADLVFVTIEGLKQVLRVSYLARYQLTKVDHQGKGYGTGDFILTMIGRFSFFMSLYWVTNLSRFLRQGNVKALHARHNILLSVLVSLTYGCMHAVLPTLRAQDKTVSKVAITVTAFVLLVMQVSPLLIIVVNLRLVKKARLYTSTQGRNVIRRLMGYGVCATVFTLPYALVLTLSYNLVVWGVITETLSYLLPVANAVLFGTSLSCCCMKEMEMKSTPEDKMRVDETPCSSIEIALIDGNTTPRSTGYTGLGVVPGTEGVSLGHLAEMVTEEPAIKIGEGSSATVYKAQWLGITIALKCLRLQACNNSEAELYVTHLAELQTEFLDEAVLASQLRHPNITLFMRMGTYQSTICLVSEYCARGSLRDVLRANPLLEWNTRVRLAFEAAKGLAFMHNREPIYLHRDLKASNILVTADWRAKIADFGIARIATAYAVKKQRKSLKFSRQSLQSSLQSIDESVVMLDNDASELMTTFAGTWRWNAPEIMKNPNECRFNRQTDMYSFGMALWEILTNGAIPFGNVDFDHQVRQLVAAGERPVLPPSYVQRAPPEFIEVIRACWHQRPDERPSAQDVMMRLGSLTYTLSSNSEFYSSSLNTARLVFSDNYSHTMDSNQSCPGLSN